jgi:hypothetical protein
MNNPATDPYLAPVLLTNLVKFGYSGMAARGAPTTPNIRTAVLDGIQLGIVVAHWALVRRGMELQDRPNNDPEKQGVGMANVSLVYLPLLGKTVVDAYTFAVQRTLPTGLAAVNDALTVSLLAARHATAIAESL